MKPTLLSLFLFCAVTCPAQTTAPSAVEEQRLIAVLRSDAGPREKDEACARLKRIGTDHSVAALSTLLTDEQLSHSARYALEGMQSPTAGKALVAALGHTSGALKVGIIDSIGVRADRSAEPSLKKLLIDPDIAIAQAAAAALGHIGDTSGLKALVAAIRQSTGQVHLAQVQACLACGQAVLRSGHSNDAKAAFELIYTNEAAPAIRLAAFRGVIYSSGQKSHDLILNALAGDPRPSQMAALQVIHERDFGVADELPSILPDIQPAIQVAILDGLTQNGNRAAVDVARPLITSENIEVRLAAIRCLGALADSAAIPLLEKPAAYSSGPEKISAQSALVRLHHGKITDGLVAQLRTADAPIKAEAARALGRRADTNAIPALFEAAIQESDSVQTAAVQALGLLGRRSDVGPLVDLVVQANSDDTRSAAIEALNSMLQRLLPTHGDLDLTPISNAIKTSPAHARIALLDICSGLKSAQLRDSLRSAVHDSDPKVRAAAIRAICDTTDVELLPDLLSLATDKSDEKMRALAISGCVRLLTQEENVKVPNIVKIESFNRILATSPTEQEKRLVLSGLARVPDIESLKLADSLLDDSAVQPEAAQAIIKIANSLPAAQRAQSEESLDRISKLPVNEETRKAAADTLKKLHSH